MSFSLITTCKGRLAHLKQSLPAFVDSGAEQIIVVDYACPDRTQDWVRDNFPQVTIVALTDRPYFNPSDARNSGAWSARGDYLLFLDADVLISRRFVRRLPASPPKLVRFATQPNSRGLSGSCLVQTAAFQEVGGYDTFLGERYGYEDFDLYRRLDAAEGMVVDMTGEVTVLDHDDRLRTNYKAERERALASLINLWYMKIKLHVMNQTTLSRLDDESCRRILDCVSSVVRETRDWSLPASVRLHLPCGDFSVTLVANQTLLGAINRAGNPYTIAD
jgi:glycosyltransferase involved in cell wall biosynthesis